jgi:hypothetical protein
MTKEILAAHTGVYAAVVSFEEAWGDRIEVRMSNLTLHVISKAHLIRCKQSSGRDVDESDIRALQ